jgi:hypothetical protein
MGWIATFSEKIEHEDCGRSGGASGSPEQMCWQAVKCPEAATKSLKADIKCFS